MSDKPEPPTSQPNYLYIVIEVGVAIAAWYFLAPLLRPIINPIVDGTLRPALQAVGL